MRKYLIEYKSFPCVLNHDFNNISGIKFFATYSTQKIEYIIKEFDSLDQAIDFEIEKGEKKLVFISLISGDDNFSKRNYFIEYDNKTLTASEEISFSYGYKIYKIYFSEEVFRITRRDKTGKSFEFDKYYTRIDNDKISDSFVDLIPKFNDVFLEAFFIFDVIWKNTKKRGNSLKPIEIEALIMQGKKAFEERSSIPFSQIKWQQIPSISKEGDSGTSLCKKFELPGLSICKVEYSAGYRSDFCFEKGQIFHCLEGEIIIEISGTDNINLSSGDTWLVSNDTSSHRSFSEKGVKLLIIEGDFLINSID